MQTLSDGEVDICLHLSASGCSLLYDSCVFSPDCFPVIVERYGELSALFEKEPHMGVRVRSAKILSHILFIYLASCLLIYTCTHLFT